MGIIWHDDLTTLFWKCLLLNLQVRTETCDGGERQFQTNLSHLCSDLLETIGPESKNKDKKDPFGNFSSGFISFSLLRSETERVLLYQSSSGPCDAIIPTHPSASEPACRGNISKLTIVWMHNKHLSHGWNCRSSVINVTLLVAGRVVARSNITGEGRGDRIASLTLRLLLSQAVWERHKIWGQFWGGPAQLSTDNEISAPGQQPFFPSKNCMYNLTKVSFI